MPWSAIVLTFLSLAQVAESDPRLSKEEIAAAIEQLSHDQFAERETAMNRLWHAGEEAEAALIAAQKSSDPEVRFRATLVLDRFRKGIYPDTPKESVIAIEMFHRDPNLRPEAMRRLKAAGDFRSILRLVRMAGKGNDRNQLAQTLAAELPQLINDRIVQNDLRTAAELMSLQATANHRDAQRRMAWMWLQAGELDERIETLAAKEMRSDEETRQLILLHEIKGDNKAARKLAATIGDPELHLRLAERDRDWKAAAELYDKINLVDESTELATLGVSAAWHQLKNSDDVYRKRVQQIVAQAKANPKEAAASAEALFVLGETDAALEIAAKTNPVLAFDVYVARHQYAEAFALAKVEPGTRFDAAWVNALPIGSAEGIKPDQARSFLAAQVAIALHRLGDERAMQVTGAMEAHLEEAMKRLAELPKEKAPPRAAPDDPFGAPRQNAQAEAVASVAALSRMWIHALRKSGREEEAFATAEKLMERGVAAQALLPILFHPAPASNVVQSVWQQSAAQTNAERMKYLRDVLTPGSPAAEAAIRAAAKRPVAADVDPFGEARGGVSLTVALELCSLHDRNDLAIELLEGSPRKDAGTLTLLAERYLAAERYEEAAITYRQALEARPIAASYAMLALAVDKQGHADEAAALGKTSLLLASEPSQMVRLFEVLRKQEEHAKIREMARALEPVSEHFNLYLDQPLGNLQARSKPLEAVVHFEAIRRQFLSRSGVFFTEHTDYANFPHTIHRVRARGLLAAGKRGEALTELRKCRAIQPASSELVEAFVPALIEAGAKQEADEMFDAVMARHREIVTQWPLSAFHRNSIAWTSARCERGLEEALIHALEATKLAPQEAAYVDTLAEVYFVRGDTAKAIETQRRAVELAPRVPLFSQRLKEFEAAARGEKVERTFAAPSDDV